MISNLLVQGHVTFVRALPVSINFFFILTKPPRPKLLLDLKIRD